LKPSTLKSNQDKSFKMETTFYANTTGVFGGAFSNNIKNIIKSTPSAASTKSMKTPSISFINHLLSEKTTNEQQNKSNKN
jgi:hypothetical protein